MRKSIFVALISLATFTITSCGPKPTSCIVTPTGSYSVGDTVRITSCSTNTDIYTWNVDDEEGVINTIYSSDPAVAAFLPNYYSTSASVPDECEPYVDIVFLEAGTFEIFQKNVILTEGTCNSNTKFWRKEDNSSITLTIN